MTNAVTPPAPRFENPARVPPHMMDGQGAVDSSLAGREKADGGGEGRTVKSVRPRRQAGIAFSSSLHRSHVHSFRRTPNPVARRRLRFYRARPWSRARKSLPLSRCGPIPLPQTIPPAPVRPTDTVRGMPAARGSHRAEVEVVVRWASCGGEGVGGGMDRTRGGGRCWGRKLLEVVAAAAVAVLVLSCLAFCALRGRGGGQGFGEGEEVVAMG